MMLGAVVTFVLGLGMPAQTPTAAPPAQALLTPANVDKLRKVTLSGSKTSTLDPAVVKILAMGGEAVTVKQFKAETALGLYVFTVPVKPGDDDLVFSFRDPSGVTYNYLSNSQQELRAAMASDADGNRALSKEEAAAGFKTTLQAWALIVRRVP